MISTASACSMVALLFAIAAMEYDKAKPIPVGDPDSYSLLATVAMVGGAVFGCLVYICLNG
jgi:hypothetical protein